MRNVVENIIERLKALFFFVRRVPNNHMGKIYSLPPSTAHREKIDYNDLIFNKEIYESIEAAKQAKINYIKDFLESGRSIDKESEEILNSILKDNEIVIMALAKETLIYIISLLIFIFVPSMWIKIPALLIGIYTAFSLSVKKAIKTALEEWLEANMSK